MSYQEKFDDVVQEIIDLKKISPNTPKIDYLQKEIKFLEKQIEQEKEAKK